MDLVDIAAGRVAYDSAGNGPPTLVINAAADLRYLQDVSRLMASGIPGARHLDLDETAQLPPVERPADVKVALLEFLGTPPLET